MPMYCSEITVVALVFLPAGRISWGDLICIFAITVEILARSLTKLTSLFHASVLLLIINFVITLSK